MRIEANQWQVTANLTVDRIADSVKTGGVANAMQQHMQAVLDRLAKETP